MRKHLSIQFLFRTSAFIALLILMSCNRGAEGGKEPVARVQDEYLYLADLQGIVPENTSPSDSLALINEYIDTWIRRKLLLLHSENNLSDKQKDFSRQMEEYRASLVIFQYEKELIRQRLDTVVSDAEIIRYYDENKQNFLLAENIVKAVYVKLMKSTPAATVRNLIRSEKPQDRDKLREYCSKYAVNYYLDDQNWLLFNDILKEIPIKTYNQEEYLKNNRFIEIQDSLYTYIMDIRGFMTRESPSPLSFEKENIRSIILNKRKLNLIGEMEKSVYEEALKKGSFEMFIKPGAAEQ